MQLLRNKAKTVAVSIILLMTTVMIMANFASKPVEAQLAAT